LGWLDASGIIIHINPLQEWFQPGGDSFCYPPLVTLNNFLEFLDLNKIKSSSRVIVKEVGQGMGPASLQALLELPLAAVEFAAFGGTNFSKLERMRNRTLDNAFDQFIYQGHSSSEMVEFVRQVASSLEVKKRLKVNHFIVAGGIRDFLDGHYLTSRLGYRSIFGYASRPLIFAQQSYEEVRNFFQHQIMGLMLARQFLRVRE
ncbi:MAG: isopentenyl-diphosphate delta-isomerase, partial [Oligoflexia bacterium]|nr:isopentenyl-diphosphate delta-isomerase [Oligoflexia bacterium]